LVKIYTKTGDGGQTGTLRGRMGKDDQLAVALGALDEINSWMGLCRYQCKVSGSQFKKIDMELAVIQSELLKVGSLLAGSKKKRLGGVATKRLESLIDELDKQLPKLSNFILPTGVGPAAYLQVARSVARRTEREVVKYVNSKHEIRSSKQFWDLKSKTEKNMLMYLNRLSDVLFVMGRWVNRELKGKDEVWK